MFSFLIIAGGFAADDEPAILLKGPVPHDGIEFLGANAIPSYYGEYKYDGGSIRIYYTDEHIVLSDEWTAADCGISGLLMRTADDERQTAAYTDKKGWTAFLSFEAGTEYICSFIESYRKRQNYFLNIAKDKSIFSFPAILDL